MTKRELRIFRWGYLRALVDVMRQQREFLTEDAGKYLALSPEERMLIDAEDETRYVRRKKMPLTSKGKKVKAAMTKEYGSKKGESVFYASINKGKLKGMEGKKKKIK